MDTHKQVDETVIIVKDECEHYLLRFFVWVVNPLGVLVMLFMLECGIKTAAFSNETTLLDLGPKFSFWAISVFFTLWCTTAAFRPKLERTIQKDDRTGTEKEVFEVFSNNASNRKHLACLAGLFISVLIWVAGLLISGKANQWFFYAGGLTNEIIIWTLFNIFLGVAMATGATKMLNEVKK